MPAPKKNSDAKKVQKKSIPKVASKPAHGIDFEKSKYNQVPKKGYNLDRFEKTYDTLDGRGQAFINMIIDPESCETTVRNPNVYGLSSVFKGVNIINAAFDSNGESIVAVHPCLSNAIFTTAPADHPFVLTRQDTVDAKQNYCSQKINFGSSTNKQADITEPFFFDSNHCALPIPVDNQGSVHYLYPITAVGLEANALHVPQVVGTFDNYPLQVGTNLAGGPFTLATCWYTAGLVQIGTANDPSNNLNTCVTAIADAINRASYISFRIQYNGNHSYDGTVTLTLVANSTAAGNFDMKLPHVYTHCIVSDINGSKQIEATAEKYVVVAQSCLTSFRGSSINNAGVISSCRMVSGADCVGAKAAYGVISPSTASVYYNWISSLNNMKMDGALKDGAYSWYLGSDPSHYFLRDVQDQSFSDYPYLITAFNCPVANSANTVRIKVVTHVMFTTNNTVYDSKPSDYMKNKDLCMQILGLINSSYSNEGHIKGLTDQLKSIGKKVGKALINPSTYLDIAEILMLLGL